MLEVLQFQAQAYRPAIRAESQSGLAQFNVCISQIQAYGGQSIQAVAVGADGRAIFQVSQGSTSVAFGQRDLAQVQVLDRFKPPVLDILGKRQNLATKGFRFLEVTFDPGNMRKVSQEV
jgi:hypothetical protein